MCLCITALYVVCLCVCVCVCVWVLPFTCGTDTAYTVGVYGMQVVPVS